MVCKHCRWISVLVVVAVVGVTIMSRPSAFAKTPAGANEKSDTPPDVDILKHQLGWLKLYEEVRVCPEMGLQLPSNAKGIDYNDPLKEWTEMFIAWSEHKLPKAKLLAQGEARLKLKQAEFEKVVGGKRAAIDKAMANPMIQADLWGHCYAGAIGMLGEKSSARKAWEAVSLYGAQLREMLDVRRNVIASGQKPGAPPDAVWLRQRCEAARAKANAILTPIEQKLVDDAMLALYPTDGLPPDAAGVSASVAKASVYIPATYTPLDVEYFKFHLELERWYAFRDAMGNKEAGVPAEIVQKYAQLPGPGGGIGMYDEQTLHHQATVDHKAPRQVLQEWHAVLAKHRAAVETAMDAQAVAKVRAMLDRPFAQFELYVRFIHFQAIGAMHLAQWREVGDVDRKLTQGVFAQHETWLWASTQAQIKHEPEPADPFDAAAFEAYRAKDIGLIQTKLTVDQQKELFKAWAILYPSGPPAPAVLTAEAIAALRNPTKPATPADSPAATQPAATAPAVSLRATQPLASSPPVATLNPPTAPPAPEPPKPAVPRPARTTATATEARLGYQARWSRSTGQRPRVDPSPQ